MNHTNASESAERLARAKAGDRVALEALLGAVAPAIHRFGLRMCKHESDAEDVLQETLLYASSHLAQFEERASFSTWLFSVARTACLRKRRGLKHKAHVGEDALHSHASPTPDPEVAAGQQEFVNIIQQALLALSDEHREAVLLRDVEGLSARETADVLGISVEALKSRLHRARNVLRSHLSSEVVTVNPTCPDIVAAWSQNLEGDLSSEDCNSLAHHVAACPSCSRACDALKSALSVCRAASV
jgi:RNA polymerase sigma-70 factor, ECF subfamily